MSWLVLIEQQKNVKPRRVIKRSPNKQVNVKLTLNLTKVHILIDASLNSVLQSDWIMLSYWALTEPQVNVKGTLSYLALIEPQCLHTSHYSLIKQTG